MAARGGWWKWGIRKEQWVISVTKKHLPVIWKLTDRSGGTLGFCCLWVWPAAITRKTGLLATQALGDAIRHYGRQREGLTCSGGRGWCKRQQQEGCRRTESRWLWQKDSTPHSFYAWDTRAENVSNAEINPSRPFVWYLILTLQKSHCIFSSKNVLALCMCRFNVWA